MTFEQTKNIIIEHRTFINDVCRERTENYIYDFLLDMINHIENDLELDKNNEFIETYNYTINHFIDVTIKSKVSVKDKVVISCISDLLYNVSIKYNLESNKSSLNALCILSEENRSLEDIIFVLTFMFNKLSHNLYDESTTSFISRKYYYELSEYLSNRSSHDDAYNI